MKRKYGRRGGKKNFRKGKGRGRGKGKFVSKRYTVPRGGKRL